MQTLDNRSKNIEMVKEFVDTFISNLVYALGLKTFKVKIIYTLMFTIMISPIAWLSDFVKSFLQINAFLLSVALFFPNPLTEELTYITYKGE